jgi:hypothetical protein
MGTKFPNVLQLDIGLLYLDKTATPNSPCLLHVHVLVQRYGL